MAKLNFYARGTAQVTDPHAQERNIRRCVGRRWQEVLPGRWAWVPTGKPDAVEYHHDLAKAARDGDLWPADEETAKACGVDFVPDFDKETTETIKEFKVKEEAKAKALAAVEEKPKAGAGSKAGKGEV